MPLRENLGLTTFVDELEDGSQVHRSDPIAIVSELGEELRDAIGVLGDAYAATPEFANDAEGLGLTIHSRSHLGRMPALDRDKRDHPVHSAAHGVLCAFGKQLSVELHDTQQPDYIRIMYSGPNSGYEGCIPLIWHTDALIPKRKQRSEITANLPKRKRLIVSSVLNGHDDEGGRTEWVEGDLVVPKPCMLDEDVKTYEDIFWAEPHDRARITRDGKSIIRLALTGQEPPTEMVRQLPEGVIGEFGTTTIHRGTLADTALRVSLQCYFEQN